MKKIICCFVLIAFSFACKKAVSDKSAKVNELYATLKDGQAKAFIKINGKEFYVKESIFTTDIMADDNFLRASIFDQFESNIVINLGSSNWHKEKPYKLNLSIDRQIEGGLMIGKLVDKEKGVGEGYLMTEGELVLESFSKEKCVFIAKGKVGKFESKAVPEEWLDLEAIIVFKKPKIELLGLSEKEVYF